MTDALARLCDEERRRILHFYAADPAPLRLEALRAGLADVVIVHEPPTSRVLSTMTTAYRSTLGDVDAAESVIRALLSAGPRR